MQIGEGNLLNFILRTQWQQKKQQAKQNTIKNGIEIKSPAVLEKYENKIIISLIGRVDQVSKDLINQYNIDPKRIISPIDYSYRTLN